MNYVFNYKTYVRSSTMRDKDLLFCTHNTRGRVPSRSIRNTSLHARGFIYYMFCSVRDSYFTVGYYDDYY